MPESLLASTFLFRFSAPCYRRETLWGPGGLNLEERYVLPYFGDLEKRPRFADVRVAWNETGIAFSVRVTGKRQPPWCRESRIEDSDGVQWWIDTRDTHNIHRAGRHCHRFLFLPAGGGRTMQDPCGRLAEINRARDNPKPVSSSVFKLRSEKRIDGYLLEVMIPAAAMTGYEPADHPRLGFSYAVVDRELGWQTFTVGPEFPFTEDPSLWGTLELV